MTATPDGTPPMHDPLADLERHLINAYVTGAGHDVGELLKRGDESAKRVLAEASQFASARLSEVEARWRFLHKLHGEP